MDQSDGPGAMDTKRSIKHRALLLAALAAMGLLAACADPQASAYRKDPHALMKEVVYCENNYATIGTTPQCRAALQVNSELFH